MIVSIIVVAGLLTPGYSHLSDTISQLGAQGRLHPGLMNTGFIIYGVLIIGFSYALYRQLGYSTAARVAWLMLTMYGVGIILAGIFRDFPDGTNTVINLEGILHNVFATAAFFALLGGMLMFAKIVYHRPAWHGLTWFTIAIAAFNLVLSLIFITEVFVSVEGGLQRLFYFTSLVWKELVSIRLFRLSGYREE
jgi:hypothetical membrane protein